MNVPRGRVRIGVDIGGTFTDLVLLSGGGEIVTRKIPTPEEYGRAGLGGARGVLEQVGVGAGFVREVVHGTTVTTSARLRRHPATRRSSAPAIHSGP